MVYNNAKMNEYDTEMVGILKNRVSDLVKPDFNNFDFLRWLQGHDYNLNVIVPKLRHHLRFKYSLDFSPEVFRLNEVCSNYYMFGLLGLTGKDDNLVYIDTIGSLDGEGIIKSMSAWDFYLHRFYVVEEFIMKSIRKHENESGRQSGVVVVQDLIGCAFNAHNVWLISTFLKNLCRLFLSHYSEVVLKNILVNVPPFLTLFLNLIKPVLPEKTRNKIIILGNNWKTELLEHVTADAIPVHWGGTMVDENGDPKCGTKVNVCTKVPESLYWKPSSDNPPLEELTVLTVNAGQVSYVTVKVDTIGSFVKWFYHTDKDWGFGVFFTEDENETDPLKMDMVYPQIEYVKGPSLVPEIGKIKCKRTGFYKLWFNNYFSWITKLQVKYKLDLVEH